MFKDILVVLITITAFSLGLIVQKAIDSDRLLPKDSTVFCPSESSCRYDYYDKQPHVLRTGD